MPYIARLAAVLAKRKTLYGFAITTAESGDCRRKNVER